MIQTDKNEVDSAAIEFMKKGSLVDVVPRETWVMYTCQSEDVSVHCLPFNVSCHVQYNVLIVKKSICIKGLLDCISLLRSI